VSKSVRHRFSFSKGSFPFVQVLWQIANKVFPDLIDRKILFVGYSALNRQLLSYFLQKQASRVTLVSRFPLQTTEYAVKGREVLQKWDQFDVIICASDAKEYLVSGRGKENVLLFDLGVPRNIDPSLAERSKLYTLEDVHDILAMQQNKLTLEVSKAEQWVASHAQRLFSSYALKNRHVPDIWEKQTHHECSLVL